MKAGERERLRFFSIRLDHLLMMSYAEIDFLDALPPEQEEDWFRLWESTLQTYKPEVRR